MLEPSTKCEHSRILYQDLMDVWEIVAPYVVDVSCPHPESLMLSEAKESWQLFCKYMKALQDKYQDYFCDFYLKGIKTLAFHENYIPSLSVLSESLALWGWKPIWIKGYVPSKVYAALIARSYFPIASIMRRKNFFKHSPIPDFIHDVFGHLPLLCDPQYSKYIKELASALENSVANKFDEEIYEVNARLSLMKHNSVSIDSLDFIQAKQQLDETYELAEQSPSQEMYLSRIFLWSIEFSLFQQKDQNNSLKITGSGILSSPDEIMNVIEKKVTILPYSLGVVFKSFRYFSTHQPEFFIIYDINCWRDTLKAFLNENTKVL